MANLILDRRLQKVTFKNREVGLSPLEFEVLWILSGFSERTLSPHQIAGMVEDLECDCNIKQVEAILLDLPAKFPHARIPWSGLGR